MATGPHPTSRTTSRRSILVAIAVAAVAAGALVAAALLLRDDGGSRGSAPAGVDLTGIPQDGSSLGDANAPVTLVEYADMQCPFCADWSEEMLPTLVTDYVRPGNVRADFRAVAILGADSETAARFVIAAGLQDRLWEFQEALYGRQGGENEGWVTDEVVREAAEEVPGLDVEQLFADEESAEVAAQLQENMARFQADGATGTPTVMLQIGDQEPYMIQVGLDPEALSAALDDALAG
jgi:protein-disulfide isomerase